MNSYGDQKKSTLAQISIFFAVLLGIVGVSIFFLLRFQSQPSTDPVKASAIIEQETQSTETETLNAETVPEEIEPTKSINIYADAWSLAALSGEQVQLVDAEENVLQNVSFSPISSDEIQDLLGSDPAMVTSMMSRLYSPDSRLSCTPDGCFIDSTELDTSPLANLANVPVFGEIYKSNNIDTGIYKATVTIPESSISFGLKSDSYPTYFFSLDPRTEEGIDLFTPLDDNSTNFYIAAGLGRLFPAAPAWSESSRLEQARWNPRSAELLDESDIPGLVSLYESDPFAAAFSDKSADLISASRGLNPYYLTYLTSPVSGCGLSTICSVEDVEVQRSEVFAESGLVCSANGEKLLAVVSSSKWSVNLPSESHILGYWGESADPEFFPNSESYQSVLGYLGDPPLVQGPSEFYNLNLYLLDSNGIVRLEAARSVDKSDIPNVTLDTIDSAFNGEYTRCP